MPVAAAVACQREGEQRTLARQAHTGANTDERALELDHTQYASGRGPCLEAASRRTPVRAAIASERRRWPEFVDAAQLIGIHASLRTAGSTLETR